MTTKTNIQEEDRRKQKEQKKKEKIQEAEKSNKEAYIGNITILKVTNN